MTGMRQSWPISRSYVGINEEISKKISGRTADVLDLDSNRVPVEYRSGLIPLPFLCFYFYKCSISF